MNLKLRTIASCYPHGLDWTYGHGICPSFIWICCPVNTVLDCMAILSDPTIAVESTHLFSPFLSLSLPSRLKLSFSPSLTYSKPDIVMTCIAMFFSVLLSVICFNILINYVKHTNKYDLSKDEHKILEWQFQRCLLFLIVLFSLLSCTRGNTSLVEPR